MFNEDPECQKWQAELEDHQEAELEAFLGETAFSVQRLRASLFEGDGSALGRGSRI